MVTDNQQPILVLGAGINGAALARELLLNRQPVCLVDTADLASGTTAYSSRLIHGGLRYLEYGEFSLVRESLAERERLLRLAPQFVSPRRFHIPIRHRLGGWKQAIGRFFGWTPAESSVPRGLWLVRTGLAFYDWLARYDHLPGAKSGRVETAFPAADRSQFRWLCSYSDTQILYPERFVVALLEDARELARQHGVAFDFFNYCNAQLAGREVSIRRGSQEVHTLVPSAIVNATGAWVDLTLEKLQLDSPRLIGGTKGSHLLVNNRWFAEQLDGDAVYLEARDGRPVFLLPFHDLTLIGTTDLPFDECPANATVSDGEVDYLLEAANELLVGAELTRQDVVLHYAGVRPLANLSTSSPAGAITRRHFLKHHHGTQPVVFSVVGGKLTTCRALAEQTAREVMQSLGSSWERDSRERILPGAAGYPRSESERIAELSTNQFSDRFLETAGGGGLEVMWDPSRVSAEQRAARRRLDIGNGTACGLCSARHRLRVGGTTR